MASDLHLTVSTRLRATGQRYTARRRQLVEVLSHAAKPVSIPDILAGDRALPQSSVYRNLAVLQQARVVRRVVTSEEFARYELAEDLTGHHHHLMCSNCGAVQDFTMPRPLEESVERAVDQVARRSGFSPAGHRLDLIGTCRNCG